MGIFDKLKGAASSNPDKVSQGLDKAGDMVDQKTGGQHGEHIDKGVDAAKGHFGIEDAAEADAPAEAPQADAPAEAPQADAPAEAPQADAGEPGEGRGEGGGRRQGRGEGRGRNN